MTAQGTLCHRCQQPVSDFYARGEVLRLRHLPVFERPVYLLWYSPMSRPKIGLFKVVSGDC
jgi:hypothetical protein